MAGPEDVKTLFDVATELTKKSDEASKKFRTVAADKKPAIIPKIAEAMTLLVELEKYQKTIMESKCYKDMMNGTVTMSEYEAIKDDVKKAEESATKLSDKLSEILNLMG